MNELSLYILDICENSIHADSKNLYLTIEESIKDNLLIITIEDDGRGMSKEVLEKVANPFYTTRTTRKVGLGIPLFKELCELCEGSFEISSTVGVGTKDVAKFKLDSIDLPPLGNIEDTLYCLACNDKNVELTFKYIKGDKEFAFSTLEIKEVLDGIPFSEPSIVQWFKDMVIEGINGLN